MTVKAFPDLERETHDLNPAIQIFGRRFYKDQTTTELLLELFIVIASAKRIGEKQYPSSIAFPPLEDIVDWPSNKPLQYSPNYRINLKLFALLSSSKLDARHKTHRKHYLELVNNLKNRIKSESTDSSSIIKTLENLFQGFQGFGGTRAWCAQGFLPITRGLIAGETIWTATKAARNNTETWEDAQKYFSHTQHAFLARGGEVLYLQICNALRQDKESISNWLTTTGIGQTLSKNERDPKLLYTEVENSLKSILKTCPDTIDELVNFIDSDIERTTSTNTENESANNSRYQKCGWCPTESWQEGYLFTIELNRLCSILLDPIERLQLLEIASAMQVLRSLSAQGMRYSQSSKKRHDLGGSLGYIWVLSDPDGDNAITKQISQRSVKAIQQIIRSAIRHPEIQNPDNQLDDSDFNKADQNGHKLFLTVAKRIGFIIPKFGKGARFVFNDKILRFLVLSLVRPGSRITYDTFKQLLFTHYGIAVDNTKIGDACEWNQAKRLSTFGNNSDEWLISMLNASGMLIQLSDACSMVTNPFTTNRGTS